MPYAPQPIYPSLSSNPDDIELDAILKGNINAYGKSSAVENTFNSEAQTSAAGRVAPIRNVWTCAICTFDNPALHSFCGACGKSKGTQARDHTVPDQQDNAFGEEQLLRQLRQERHNEVLQLQMKILQDAAMEKSYQGNEAVSKNVFLPDTVKSSKAPIEVQKRVSQDSYSAPTKPASSRIPAHNHLPYQSPVSQMRPAESAMFGFASDAESMEMRKILSMSSHTAETTTMDAMSSSAPSHVSSSSQDRRRRNSLPVEQMRPAESAMFGLASDAETMEMRKILSMNMPYNERRESTTTATTDAMSDMSRSQDHIKRRNSTQSCSPVEHMRPAESAMFGSVADREATEMRKILSMNMPCGERCDSTTTATTGDMSCSVNSHVSSGSQDELRKKNSIQSFSSVSTSGNQTPKRWEDAEDVVTALKRAGLSGPMFRARTSYALEDSETQTEMSSSSRDGAHNDSRRRASAVGHLSSCSNVSGTIGSSAHNTGNGNRTPWEDAEEELMAAEKTSGDLLASSRSTQQPWKDAKVELITAKRASFLPASSHTARKPWNDAEDELLTTKRASFHSGPTQRRGSAHSVSSAGSSSDNTMKSNEIEKAVSSSCNSPFEQSDTLQYLSSCKNRTNSGRRESVNIDGRPGSTGRAVSSLWMRAMERAQSIDLDPDVMEKIAARSNDQDLPDLNRMASNSVKPGAYHKSPGTSLVRNRSLAWAKKRASYTRSIQRQLPLQHEEETQQALNPNGPTATPPRKPSAEEEKLRNEASSSKTRVSGNVPTLRPPQSSCARGISGVTLDGELLDRIVNGCVEEEPENLNGDTKGAEDEESDCAEVDGTETELNEEAETAGDESGMMEEEVTQASEEKEGTIGSRFTLKKAAKSFLKKRILFRRNSVNQK